MRLGLVACLFIWVGALASARAQDPFAGQAPQRVTIRDYVGDAMEPFLSRDGRYLFFNTSNDDPAHTDLLYAERIDPVTFRSLGPVLGANSPTLDAVPSMDRQSRLYFVSTRAYDQTLNTLFVAPFVNGQVYDPRALNGLAAPARGRLHFDAEISADGRSLYFAEGLFWAGAVPWEADLFIARRYAEGRFARDARSNAIFARINTSALEYAPALSADERELFFTRLGRMPLSQPSIWRAARPDPRVAFSAPTRLDLPGFVEAPTLAADGSIYYHRRLDGRFIIYRLRRAPAAAPAGAR